MYTEEYLSKIQVAWENFKKGIYLGEEYIRKEIMDSWIRSKNNGVNFDYAEKKIISKKALEHRISDRQDLYDIAIPFLKSLYKFVAGSGFIAILSDDEGYVLKTLGDPDIIKKAHSNLLIEGCNRNEKTLGTNGIGTCLYMKKPIQICAGEHYYEIHHDWTCSGAPIFDQNGELIGSLCLTGTWENVHIHTLGMVVSAAEAISKQLTMKYTYSAMLDVKNKLNVIIETVQYGIILLDKNREISQINTMAARLLQEKSENIIGKNINCFMKSDYINFDKVNKNIYDKYVNVEYNSNNFNFSVSVFTIYKECYLNNGLVVTFRKTETLHKMVNKIVGSDAHFNFNDIIGSSPAIMAAKKLGVIAAENTSTVLLTGESGTGKELFAQSIHNSSAHNDGPFIAINCGSLPRSLIESELFGYESGTFTGAKKEGHAGKFELANGGTIFLDEIGDMPYDVQVSLLRVLQSREIMRIGSTRAIKIDVRIIAATNKNLEAAIENNTFRSDLYYRLNVFNIKIPSLKDRIGDVKLLSNYFLKKYKVYSNKVINGISSDVYKVLDNYKWPGNIRELENTIERSTLICRGGDITVEDLPENIIMSCRTTKSAISNEINYSVTQNINSVQHQHLSMPDIEKNSILEALNVTKGNIKKASDILGMSRRTLYRKFTKYDIDYDKIRTD